MKKYVATLAIVVAINMANTDYSQASSSENKIKINDKNTTTGTGWTASDVDTIIMPADKVGDKHVVTKSEAQQDEYIPITGQMNVDFLDAITGNDRTILEGEGWTYDKETYTWTVYDQARVMIQGATSGLSRVDVINGVAHYEKVAEGNITIANNATCNLLLDAASIAGTITIGNNCRVQIALVGHSSISSAKTTAIRVPVGSSLIIREYGGPYGAASLYAYSAKGGCSAIGGHYQAGPFGEVIINSGTITTAVTSTSGHQPPDIGPGLIQINSAGRIIINGGYVNTSGAGIGGVSYGNPPGYVEINGGTVIAKKIGNASSGGTTIINGGSVHSREYFQWWDGSVIKNSAGVQLYPVKVGVCESINTGIISTTLVNPATRTQINSAVIDYVQANDIPDPTNQVYGMKDLYTDEDGYLYLWLPTTGTRIATTGLASGNAVPVYTDVLITAGTAKYYTSAARTEQTRAIYPLKITAATGSKAVATANNNPINIPTAQYGYNTDNTTATINVTDLTANTYTTKGAGTVNATISSANFDVTPYSLDFTNEPATTKTFTVKPAAGLIPGTYTGAVTITGQNATVDYKYIPITFTVTKGPQTDFHVNPIETKTYGTAAFNATLTGNTGSGAVTWTSTNTATATVNNNGLVTLVKPGTTYIKVSKAADNNFLEAVDSTLLTVTKGPRTEYSLTPNPVSKLANEANFKLTENNQGTGTTTWTSTNPTVATVNASTGYVTLVTAGTTNIVAARTEDDYYLAKTTQATLTVTKANQIPLVITNPGNKTYAPNTTFDLLTTGGSGNGAVSWTAVTDNITISGNVATIHAAGQATIEANKAQDPKYNATTAAQVSFTINKAIQPAFAITNPGNKTFGEQNFTLQTTGGIANINTTWAGNNDNVATVNNTGTVTINGTGQVVFTATKLTDNNYLQAQATCTLNITKQQQADFTVDGPTNKTYGDTDFLLQATGTGTPVTWTSNNTNVATVNPITGLVSIKSAGDVTFIATRNENEQFQGTQIATLPVTVYKATQPEFNIHNTVQNYGTKQFELLYSGGITSIPVTEWTSQYDTVATVHPTTGQVTVVGAGITQITAHKPENENYNATDVNANVTINKVQQQNFTINSVGTLTYGTTPVQLHTTSGADEVPIIWSHDNDHEDVATVDPQGKLHLHKAGNTTIYATRPAGNNYLNDASATLDVTVNKAPQNTFTIQGETTRSVTYQTDIPTFTLTATGGSVTGVQWISDNTGVATVTSTGNNNATVQPLGIGTTKIVAYLEDALGRYNTAADTVTLTVHPASQGELYIYAVGNKTYKSDDFIITTGGGDENITTQWTSSDTEVATVTSTGTNTAEVHIIKAGNVKFIATKPAVGNTKGAEATISVNVQKEPQTISITTPSSKYYKDLPFTLDAETGHPTLTTFWKSSKENVATVDNNGQVTIRSAGSTVISLWKQHNDNYQDVDTFRMTLRVEKQSQTTLSINPPNNPETIISGGQPVQLSYSAGHPDLDTIWISNDTDVATVDENGLVTPHHAGSATITLRKQHDENYQDVQDATLLITVNKIPQTLGITAPTGDVIYGAQPFQLDFNAGSAQLDTLWNSSDPNVATVNETGLVTVHNAGTTEISLRKPQHGDYQDVTPATLNLTVDKVSQQSLNINHNGEVTYGISPFTLDFTGGNSNLDEVWDSSDKNVATVSSTGLVTVLKVGTTNITLNKVHDDNYMDVAPAQLTLTVDKVQQKPLTIEPVYGKKYGDAPFTLGYTSGDPQLNTYWESSDDDIAEVNDYGTVTIHKTGTVTITLSKEQNTNFTDVDPVTLTLEIGKDTQDPLSIADVGTKTVGDPQFTLTAQGGETTLKTIWESDNTTVATVNDDGLVTILKAGTVTFTLSKEQDDNYDDVAPAQLTLNVQQITQIPLSIAVVGNKTYGDPNFTLTPSGGEITLDYIWESLNTDVATISQQGLVTILKPGTVTFKLSKETDPNYNTPEPATLTVEVDKIAQVPLVIQPVTSKTIGDQPFQLTFTGGNDNLGTTWESSNTNVATVNNNGQVTIIKPGNTNITVSKQHNDYYHDVTPATLTVTIDKIAQDALSINPVMPKTYGDQPFQLTFSDGHPDLTTLWSSSDNSIATVTSTGRVTIHKAGNVTITLSKETHTNYQDVTPATVTINIDKAQQAKINIGKVADKTYGNQPFELIATGGSSSNGFTWTSDNENVARVDANTGLATITGAGNVTFTATKTEDDRYLTKDTTVTVTVKPANLKITAIDTQVVYLEQIPTEFKVKYEGFVYGENVNDIELLPNANTNAVQGDSVGTYTINVTGAEAKNYNVTYANGKLKINKRNPVATDMYISPDYTVYTGKAHKVIVDTTNVKGFGKISNVQYNGTTTAPITPGNYTVTVDVAAGKNYNTAIDLTVGTLVVDKAPMDSVKLTVNNNTTPDKAVVTPANVKGLGTLTVKFNNNTNIPTTPGIYIVTVDHANGEYYQDANDFQVGTYTIAGNPTDNLNAKTTQAKVWSNKKQLFIETHHNENVRIYTLGGVLITAVQVTADQHKEITMPTGFYVVVVDGKIYKIMIR